MRLVGNSVGWTKKPKHLKVEKTFLKVPETSVKQGKSPDLNR